MIERHETLTKISFIIMEYISRGLTLDDDTINFIKSSYGVNETDEIISLLEDGDDGGTVIELVSYPADNLREEIEKFIPHDGFSEDEINAISGSFSIKTGKNYILYKDKKVALSDEDNLFCHMKILQRLNLNIPFNYLSGIEATDDEINIFTVRAHLRKKKFLSGEANSLFIDDLVTNYSSTPKRSRREFLELITLSADLLNGSGKKPFDILSEKKYFYENAVMEAEEFSRMLKVYSMEFIMMKKIQPPLISIEEARSMIQLIDRLTSIVYRMIIPSIQNVMLEDPPY